MALFRIAALASALFLATPAAAQSPDASQAQDLSNCAGAVNGSGTNPGERPRPGAREFVELPADARGAIIAQELAGHCDESITRRIDVAGDGDKRPISLIASELAD